MDKLPAPVPPNEYACPATLLIYRPVLILSFGPGAIGHDGGIPEKAGFNIIRDQRLEFYAAGLAVFQVLRPVLDVSVRAVMDVVLGQDPFQESDVRLNESRIEVLDELRQLALVAGRIAKGPAAGRKQENRNRERCFIVSLLCNESDFSQAVVVTFSWMNWAASWINWRPNAQFAASAASTSGKIRNVRSSREISKIERKVSWRPLRKNLPPYASTSCMARISAAIPALSM